MKYNKLVRDKAAERIKNDGKAPYCHIADDVEFSLRLHQKLREEVDAFFEYHTMEELVDIMEVLYALAAQKGFSAEQLEEARRKKAEERGSFKHRLILDEVKD